MFLLRDDLSLKHPISILSCLGLLSFKAAGKAEVLALNRLERV